MIDLTRPERAVAFFHNANWDALIECVPTCLVDCGMPRYPAVTAGQRLMEKFLRTQPRVVDEDSSVR